MSLSNSYILFNLISLFVWNIKAQAYVDEIKRDYELGSIITGLCVKPRRPVIQNITFRNGNLSRVVGNRTKYEIFVNECESTGTCTKLTSWRPKNLDCSNAGCHVIISYECREENVDYPLPVCPSSPAKESEQVRFCPSGSLIRFTTDASADPECFKIPECKNRQYHTTETYMRIASACNGRNACQNREQAFVPCQESISQAETVSVNYQCFPAYKYRSVSWCTDHGLRTTEWCTGLNTIVTAAVLFGARCSTNRECFNLTESEPEGKTYGFFGDDQNLAMVKVQCDGQRDCPGLSLDGLDWSVLNPCIEPVYSTQIFYTCQLNVLSLTLKIVIPIVFIGVVVTLAVVLWSKFHHKMPYISCENCSWYCEWPQDDEDQTQVTISTPTAPPMESLSDEQISYEQPGNVQSTSPNQLFNQPTHGKVTAEDVLLASTGDLYESMNDRYGPMPQPAKVSSSVPTKKSKPNTVDPSKDSGSSSRDERNFSPSVVSITKKEVAGKKRAGFNEEDIGRAKLKVGSPKSGKRNATGKSKGGSVTPNSQRKDFKDIDAHEKLEELNDALVEYDNVNTAFPSVQPIPMSQKSSTIEDQLRNALEARGTALKPNVNKKPKTKSTNDTQKITSESPIKKPKVTMKPMRMDPEEYEPQDSYEAVAFDLLPTSVAKTTKGQTASGGKQVPKPPMLSAKPTRSLEIKSSSTQRGQREARQQHPHSVASSGWREPTSASKATTHVSPKGTRKHNRSQQVKAPSPLLQVKLKPVQGGKRSPRNQERRQQGVVPRHAYDNISPLPSRKNEPELEVYDNL